MEISECTVFEFCQLLRACSAGARGADLLSRCLCFPVTSFGSQWGDHRMTGSRGWHPSAEPRSGSRTDQLGLPGKPQVTSRITIRTNLTGMEGRGQIPPDPAHIDLARHRSVQCPAIDVQPPLRVDPEAGRDRPFPNWTRGRPRSSLLRSHARPLDSHPLVVGVDSSSHRRRRRPRRVFGLISNPGRDRPEGIPRRPRRETDL
jgi:hypothetical protein